MQRGKPEEGRPGWTIGEGLGEVELAPRMLSCPDLATV